MFKKNINIKKIQTKKCLEKNPLKKLEYRPGHPRGWAPVEPNIFKPNNLLIVKGKSLAYIMVKKNPDVKKRGVMWVQTWAPQGWNQ